MNTLLQDIEQSIKSAGGRVKLQYLLIKESKAWFNHKEHMEINNKLSKQISKEKNRSTLMPHELFWKESDKKYLLQNWGHKRSSFIAEVLGRSVAGCRQKIKDLLTEEEYTNRVANGRYKSVLKNKLKLTA